MKSLATLFGVGHVSRAPGTVGSFVALCLAAIILALPQGWAILAGATVVFAVFGTNATYFYMQAHGSEDPKEVVIDELVGQWLTFSIMQVWMVVLAGVERAWILLSEVTITPAYLLLGFVLFRFFDIVKPWPISLADRKIKGAKGVMFDDILAGMAAGTTLYAVYALMPYLTGDLESMAP